MIFSFLLFKGPLWRKRKLERRNGDERVDFGHWNCMLKSKEDTQAARQVIIETRREKTVVWCWAQTGAIIWLKRRPKRRTATARTAGVGCREGKAETVAKIHKCDLWNYQADHFFFLRMIQFEAR